MFIFSPPGLDYLDLKTPTGEFYHLVENVSFLIRKMIYNVFGWSKVWSNSQSFESKVIANCVCLASSFINHSCEANAYWDFDDGVLTLATMGYISLHHAIVS